MMEEQLLCTIEKEGYRFDLNPKTVFVPHGTKESDLGDSLLLLREKYGYMIQIEIS